MSPFTHISLLSVALFAGCAAPRASPQINLSPVIAARIFSEDASVNNLMTSDQRQWFVAAAYFISRNGRAFENNKQLFSFLEADLGRVIELKKAVPVREIAPESFVMTLASGSTVNIHVSPKRITLDCVDREVTGQIVQSMMRISGVGVPSSKSSEFSWTHALTHIFR